MDSNATTSDPNSVTPSQAVQLAWPGSAQRVTAWLTGLALLLLALNIKQVWRAGARPLTAPTPTVGSELVEHQPDDELEPAPKVIRGQAPRADTVEASPTPAWPKKSPPSKILELNRATAEELRSLPGIGPKLSEAILYERSKRPYHSLADLRRVPGIGKVTLEKLRPHLTVEVPASTAGEAP